MPIALVCVPDVAANKRENAPVHMLFVSQWVNETTSKKAGVSYRYSIMRKVK